MYSTIIRLKMFNRFSFMSVCALSGFHEANFHNPFKNQLHSSQAQNRGVLKYLSQLVQFGASERVHTHSHSHTHSLTHNSPLCKSYSQISSFGRKTFTISHRLQRNTPSSLYTQNTLTSAKTKHGIQNIRNLSKQTFAII